MSLLISPHSCRMPNAPRQPTPAHSDRGSPRLKPPSSHRKQDMDHNNGNSRKQDSPKYPRGPTSRSPIQNAEVVIDPFLAQYMKPTCGLNHELYFRSLPKQVTIKSFYQKYLNLNKEKSPRVSLLRQDSALKRKPVPPLRKEIAPTHDVQMEEKQDSIDKKTPLRRRRFGSDTRVQPETKKSQPQNISEVLSLRFEECPSVDLINLMARMIQSLISLNDQSVPTAVSSPPSHKASDLAPEQKNKLMTRYHSRTPPAISIHTYISRLAKFNNLTPATLLTTIYYIDLLSHNFQPYFTLNSWTVHRFLLVATMLAQKSLEDFFFTNDHYARVGGVALTELNFLELDFLNRVDWKVVPAKQILETETSIRHSKEVLDLYYRQLVNLLGKNVTEKDKITYLLSNCAGS